MVQERSEFEQLHIVQRLSGGAGQADGPGPAASLVYDGLILAAAAMCAAAIALRGGSRRRFGGLTFAVGLMVLAATVSLVGAGNLRLALNTSADRIAALLVMLIVARTVRRWWHVRVVLAAIGATGVTYAAFCVAQVSEQQDTREWILQQKDRAVESGRISPDDPMVELLEKRATGGDVSGFFAHSNIAGSMLMTCGLAMAALGVGRLRARRRPFRRLFGFVALLGAGGAAVGLGLTHSRGAIAAGVLSVVGWAAIGWIWSRWGGLRGALTHRWRTAVAAGWVVFALIVAGTVAVGVDRGGLPGKSLTYRWYYWTGAARMLAAHPWTGVGGGNFDRHYVRYKPVEVPEEVKDPHNYLVTMAAEWGVLGLAGAVLLWAAVSITLARPTPPLAVEAGTDPESDQPAWQGVVATWMVPLLVSVLVARSVSSPAPLWLIWAFAPVLIWAIAFYALSIETDQPTRFEDEPLVLSGGLTAVLLAFVLHNMVSFSMIYPGSACTFFALAGLAVAVRRLGPAVSRDVPASSPADRSVPGTERLRRGGMAVSTVVLVAAIMYWPVLVTPVAQATGWLRQARTSVLTREVTDSYRRAVAADPVDPVAPAEMAGWALRAAQEDPAERRALVQIAVDAALAAVRRDHADNRNYRTLSGAYMARYAALGDPNDADRTVDASAHAVTLYPELPDLRLDYGEALIVQATARRRIDLFARGLDEMRYALELDDRRAPDEIRRFPPSRRAEIHDRLGDLQANPLPTSQPTTHRAGTMTPPATRGGR